MTKELAGNGLEMLVQERRPSGLCVAVIGVLRAGYFCLLYLYSPKLFDRYYAKSWDYDFLGCGERLRFLGANPLMGSVVRLVRCCGSIAGSLRYGLCGRDPPS